MEELLRRLAEGGIQNYDELLAHLSISRPMLEAMLEDLSRLGYLRQIEDGCGAACSPGCHCAVGCTIVGRGRIWALTDKGHRAASRSLQGARVSLPAGVSAGTERGGVDGL
jgi:hypothetical protein